MDALTTRAKVLVAMAAALLLAAAAVGFAFFAKGNADPATAVTDGQVRLDAPGRLLVVADRHLATVAVSDPSGPKRVSSVQCVRAYAAGRTGVCLHQDSPWTYSLRTIDASLDRTGSFRIPGLPNRARVSPSGRMVAWTSFIAGESYTSSGFSTRTGILDTATGVRVDNLESFAIERDGKPYRNVDVNFWGVTFAADDNRFYATLGTGGRRYLVEGDFGARRVRTVATNVECPSLSEDESRIAFKQAIGGNPLQGWRLSVLDLASMRVTNLAETRSIDDQPAWLSGTRIGYTVRDDLGGPSVWSVPSDGTGAPTMLVAGAESPAALAGAR